MAQRRTPVGALLEVAISAKASADQDRLISALGTIAAQDSSLAFSHDAESGQIILRGMGEAHLEVVVDQLRGAFRVELNIGAPQVAYRERIQRAVDVDYTHSKILGPMGQFARVVLRFESGAAGSGFVFANEADPEAVPDEYIAGIVEGLDASSATGVLAGFPFIESKATLIDGAYHEVDSSRISFGLAASGRIQVAQEPTRRRTG
jgi:elongation factor G